MKLSLHILLSVLFSFVFQEAGAGLGPDTFSWTEKKELGAEHSENGNLYKSAGAGETFLLIQRNIKSSPGTGKLKSSKLFSLFGSKAAIAWQSDFSTASWIPIRFKLIFPEHYFF